MPAEEDKHGSAEGNLAAGAGAQASPPQLEGAAAGTSAAPAAASAAELPGLQADLMAQEGEGPAQEEPAAAAAAATLKPRHETASAVAVDSAQPEGAAAAAAAERPGLQPRPPRRKGKPAEPNEVEERMPALRKHLEEIGKPHLLPATYLPGWRASKPKIPKTPGSWWPPGVARRMDSYAEVVRHLERVAAGAQGTLSRRGYLNFTECLAFCILGMLVSHSACPALVRGSLSEL